VVRPETASTSPSRRPLAPLDAELFRHQRETLGRTREELQSNFRETARALLR
jgi:hypothetical protein